MTSPPKTGPWRDLWGHFSPRRLWHRPCPHPSCRFHALTDEALMAHFLTAHERAVRRKGGSAGVDATAGRLGAMVAEMERREHAAQTRAKRTRRAADRRHAEMLEYQDYAEHAYVAAETATRGHMLSPAGKAAGINPVTLWTGPERQARRYASEELRGWWDQHGRLTITELRRRRAGMGRDARNERMYGVY